jgi:hypothetical protein
MIRSIKNRSNGALVTSIIALVMASGGTALATGYVVDATSDVKDGVLTQAHFRGDQKPKITDSGVRPDSFATNGPTYSHSAATAQFGTSLGNGVIKVDASATVHLDAATNGAAVVTCRLMASAASQEIKLSLKTGEYAPVALTGVYTSMTPYLYCTIDGDAKATVSSARLTAVRLPS